MSNFLCVKHCFFLQPLKMVRETLILPLMSEDDFRVATDNWIEFIPVLKTTTVMAAPPTAALLGDTVC